MLSDSYSENPAVARVVAAVSRVLDWMPAERDYRDFGALEDILEVEVGRHLKRTPPGTSEAQEPSMAPSHAEWRRITDRIGQRILEEGVSSFLRWQEVVSTMGVENALFLVPEYRHLAARQEWATTIERAIRPPCVGRPLPFFMNRRTTGNLVHHAYTAFQHLDRTGCRIWDADVIIEFGGGYGNMALLMHRLGFDGRYYIFDFPVLSSLQKFYLNANGVRASLGESANAKVCCIHDECEWTNALQDVLSGPRTRQSLIATWSLSEAPLAARAVMAPFLPSFGQVMMGYQEVFGEVDNREYVAQLKESLPAFDWSDSPVPGLPRHHFLFGAVPWPR